MTIYSPLEFSGRKAGNVNNATPTAHLSACPKWWLDLFNVLFRFHNSTRNFSIASFDQSQAVNVEICNVKLYSSRFALSLFPMGFFVLNLPASVRIRMRAKRCSTIPSLRSRQERSSTLSSGLSEEFVIPENGAELSSAMTGPGGTPSQARDRRGSQILG